MKTATFSSARVDAALHEPADSLPRDGKALTRLIGAALGQTIHRRRSLAEFAAGD